VDNNQLTTLLTILAVIGFIVLILGGVIVAVIIQHKREKERTLQLQSMASLLGLEFAPTAPLSWIPNLEAFALFSQGHSKTITNVLYGQIDGVKGALFDYQYTVGHGKHRSIHNQSVVYFEPPGDLSLPVFSLRPEGTFHKTMSAFGYQDIDFGNRPEFSKLYLLRGQDEPAVRNTFSEAALGFYEMNHGSCTDGGGNQIFVFRQGRRVETLEAQSFVHWAVGVKNLFVRRW
jgi:hypothetical protein